MKLYGISISRSSTRRARRTLDRAASVLRVDRLDEREAQLVTRLQSVTHGLTSTLALRMIAGLDPEPRCACGREVVTRFCKGLKGGPQTCDRMRSCAHADSAMRQKAARTNLRRYGHTNPASSDAVKKRTARTCRKRYGGVAPACSKRVQDRMAKTNRARYGGNAPSCSAVVRNRMERTNLERRGVRNAFQCSRAMEKAVLTSLARYGTKRPCQSARIKARIVRGFLDRYGATNVFGSEVGKRIVREGMMAKYGVEHALQHPEMHLQQQRTAYRFKRHRFGNRQVETQGFERYALLYLLRRGVHPDRVRVSAEGIDSIPYDYGRKHRRYHPDIELDGHKIIEVKSTWTLYGDYVKLNTAKAKARATIAAGLDFRMLLVLVGPQRRKHVLVLPPAWIDWKRRRLQRFVAKHVSDRIRIVKDRTVSQPNLV